MQTPKTLNQAIVNGLEEYGFHNHEKLAKYVEKHVEDYLSQKFTYEMLKDEQSEPVLKRLWNVIRSQK